MLETWPACPVPGNPPPWNILHRCSPTALSFDVFYEIGTPPNTSHPLRERNAAPHFPRQRQGPRISVRRSEGVANANSKREGMGDRKRRYTGGEGGRRRFRPDYPCLLLPWPSLPVPRGGVSRRRRVCIARNQIEQVRNPRKKRYSYTVTSARIRHPTPPATPIATPPPRTTQPTASPPWIPHRPSPQKSALLPTAATICGTAIAMLCRPMIVPACRCTRANSSVSSSSL